MDSNKNLTNNTNKKIEPGASTQRLPSLKPPRDLSLSAFKLQLSGNTNQPPKKKIYVPNFNVQRNRPQENASAPAVKQEPNTDSNCKQNHGTSPRGRGRGRGSRGSRTFIQTNSGLFSGGVESNFRGKAFRDRSDGAREKVELQKPKLNLKGATAVNKDMEDNTMKDLLRDDFVDDPSLDPDYDNCPIKLPLSQASELFIKDEATIKDDTVKIKTEPQELSDQHTKVTSQNIVAINGEVKNIKEEIPDDEINGLETKISSTGLNYDDKKSNTKTDSNILDLISSAKEDRFFQLQLPNCMPSFNVGTQNRQDDSSQANDSESNTTEQASSRKGQTLRDLPAGRVGKIQIMKSGRTRLVLGNTKMWLETGTQVAFNQELVGLDLDQASHSGKAKCLGSVALRMMVCPDWDWLVSQTS